jgi:hypothetical protein
LSHVLDYPLAKRLARNGVPVARVLIRTRRGSKQWTTAYWREDENRWFRTIGDLGPLDVIEVDERTLDQAAAIRTLSKKEGK